ncbi:GNAT family N-acetyltransferase [Streptomyces palmae]|uniref:N-acetyltransferase n=1 Tax=Streptomyces palmae TaxID=1701085 RepID=A0A4Z0H763_9ACTN|nr:GNAT family protein [Streptomyces palmae]TGB09576.1 N-acetyltransferase [Streptomyces palmae]
MTDSRYLAESARTAIRPIRRTDGAEFVRLARLSTGLHHPWLSLATTEEGFGEYITRLEQPDREGFLVCARETDEIAGFVNINNICRGAFQCGAVGYGAFAPHAGRGHLTEGLELVMRYAFGPLGLHRLEANVQPGNLASTALVRRLGFRLEGFSPDFLFIDGAWRDHDRWAITVEMLQEADRSRTAPD